MVSPFARYSLALAIVCAVAALLSGLGYRLGWWPLAIGFGILRWAAYAAIIAAAIALVGAFVTRPGGRKRGLGLSVVALMVAVVTFGVPGMMLLKAKEVPPIHDVTTDTANPPQFVAVLPLRTGAPNSTEYGGPAIAEQQRKAYPQIVPFDSDAPPEKAFSRALKAVHDKGWTIVAAVPSEGRIEATDSTLLYGFKDDIVIRVAPAPQGSRTDVRSESRVGKSDIGKNAARVSSFLEQLAKEP